MADFLMEMYSNERVNTAGLTDDHLNAFIHVRDINKDFFQKTDKQATLTQKPWDSSNPKLSGGGVITMFRGDILEKSCVNMSLVSGDKYPDKDGDCQESPFVACGVSLISHPKNPFAPIIHMNVRCISVQTKKGLRSWVGGGADLTPMYEFKEDTELFHETLKKVTLKYFSQKEYERFKTWADDYFFIPHRKEPKWFAGLFK